jgi:hypothetical protein
MTEKVSMDLEFGRFSQLFRAQQMTRSVQMFGTMDESTTCVNIW